MTSLFDNLVFTFTQLLIKQRGSVLSFQKFEKAEP
jgi:hypothetical protein